MDYEKKYKEALERAKKLQETCDSTAVVGWCEYLFPELCESEDERIRKALIKGVESCKASGWTNFGNNVDIDVVLAWLEKQEGCECIKKDWLEHIKQSWYKEGFIDGKYTPKELTINDVATLNELIDFLENGTAKLQHDLTLYANWLKTQFSPIEKQGEQKLPIEMLPEEMKTIGESLGFTTQEECDEYNQMVSNLIMSDDNKDKTKFKVGDWVVQENIGVYKIIEVCESWYEVVDNKDKHYSIGFDKEYMCHLWTIKDAKPGNILAEDLEGYPSSFVAIYKKQNKEDFNDFDSYCFVGFYGKFFEGEDGHSTEDIHPATKGQRDLLFRKMKEKGYMWDAEKKELKKIELSDVGHEYYSELLKNDTSDNIADYAYQCVYCMSHDWTIENPTWDNVQSACRLGAKWQKKHDVSADWSEEDEKKAKEELLD